MRLLRSPQAYFMTKRAVEEEQHFMLTTVACAFTDDNGLLLARGFMKGAMKTAKGATQTTLLAYVCYR